MTIANKVPTVVLICLVFAVAILIRQVMTLQTSIVELHKELALSGKNMPVVDGLDGETHIDYDSAIRMWREHGERIVPITDPSVERAMQIDRMQRRVIRRQTESQPTPESLRLEEDALKQFIDQLPESEE